MAGHKSKCNKPLPGDHPGHTTTACTIDDAKQMAVPAEKVHAFKDPPLRMNNLFGLLGLTSSYLSEGHFRPGHAEDEHYFVKGQKYDIV